MRFKEKKILKFENIVLVKKHPAERILKILNHRHFTSIFAPRKRLESAVLAHQCNFIVKTIKGKGIVFVTQNKSGTQTIIDVTYLF